MEGVGSYTLDEVCTRNRLCKASLYNLIKQGKGPRLTKLGKLTRVTPEDEAAWLRRMAQGETEVAA